MPVATGPAERLGFYGLAVLTQEADSETPFPTAQSPAREEARVPPPHGDPRREASVEGPPPEGAASAGSVRCRGRSGFQALRAAPTARSGPLAVSWLPASSCRETRLVFAINKRVGKAVVRNRLRRQLKEALRRDHTLPAGAYLVRVQPRAATLSFQELSSHVSRAAGAATRTASSRRLADASVSAQVPPRVGS